jgi:hypothetical protein
MTPATGNAHPAPRSEIPVALDPPNRLSHLLHEAPGPTSPGRLLVPRYPAPGSGVGTCPRVRRRSARRTAGIGIAVSHGTNRAESVSARSRIEILGRGTRTVVGIPLPPSSISGATGVPPRSTGSDAPRPGAGVRATAAGTRRSTRQSGAPSSPAARGRSVTSSPVVAVTACPRSVVYTRA